MYIPKDHTKHNIRYLQIDEDTGEIKQLEGKVISQEQLDAYRNLVKMKVAQNDYGAFVFLLFEYKQDLFPDLSGADITRLMFISTFLNYKGYLAYDNGNPINKEQLKTLSKLSNATFARFYKKMIDAHIMFEKDGLIYLDKQYFMRGKAKKIDSNKIRICRDGVRHLYKEADIKGHKMLSYIFKILPYINYEYNIACFNPEENDIHLIKPMTLGDFCKTVGYEANNSKRLAKELFTVTFNDECAMRYVSNKSIEFATFRIFVNPKLYYAGTDYKRVEILGEF